jgi:hypothetical protein
MKYYQASRSTDNSWMMGFFTGVTLVLVVVW